MMKQREAEDRWEKQRMELETYQKDLEKKEKELKETKAKIINKPSTTTRSQTKSKIKTPKEEKTDPAPIPQVDTDPEERTASSDEDENSEDGAQSASLKAPLMHIGNTQVHIPLPLGTLSKIKELCPNPRKNPREAGAFLAKYSAGTSLDKEDIKGILSIVDPESPEDAPIDTLWTDHVQTRQDWVSFWKGMGNHWSTLYKGSSALQELILAKQGPKEKFFDFCTRVYSLWKAVDNATPQLFTTTVMSGGDAKVTQLLKFTNPKWTDQSPDEFMKDTRSRETSGVFEQKGGIFPSLAQAQTLVPDQTTPSQLMVMQPYPPDQGCFNCGEQGHWKSQCPYRTGQRRGRGRGFYPQNRSTRPHYPPNQGHRQIPPYYPQQPAVQHEASARPPNPPPSQNTPRIPMQWPSSRQQLPQ
ncbi:uncharacterized protein LOC143998420 [Lithobates pipiens]